MIKTKSCAIFGGTFDPFHNGHLHLIDRLTELHIFERLIVVPSGNPWQKSTIASAQSRFDMARLALETRSVIVSDCEIKRSGASYAIDTLAELSKEFPSENYSWILGSDAFANVETWHRFPELAAGVEFIVISRPGEEKPVTPQGVRALHMDLAALDISATRIREMLANGEDISSWVPKPVVDYIEEKGLYGAA